MRRIATYCFYDSRGEVARHKVYYLSQLVNFLDRLVIVCNGELTAEGRRTLEQFSDDIIVRENEGNDIWAHKIGLEYIGWDELKNYDEYLLCNDTCYGPIFPFEEMFSEMDKRDCDFWGIMYNYENKNVTGHGGVKYPGGYMRDFIVCSLINVKTKLLKTYEFKRYWDTLKKMASYSEVVVFGEYQFTYYFQKSGFKWECWQDDSLRGYIDGAHEHMPYQLLSSCRIPTLRKKAVNGNRPLSNAWWFNYGDEPYKALEFIERHTNYDVNLIWDDILRNNHLCDIQERLQLEYIIPENCLEHEYTYDKKIAVICHIYYDDLVEECATYSENFPEGTDFYITTTSEETLEGIHKEYGKRGFNYQVQIVPNHRDVPKLFVTYPYVVTNGEYEYICMFHDKKSQHIQAGEIGKQFKLRCYNSLFGTENIVRNIINRFENNPRLGVIANSPPYHGLYFNVINNTWEKNYKGIEELAKRIQLDIPLSKNKCEPSAYGGMLWFRAEAYKKMMSHKFTYDDFVDVTANTFDCTISHAIERIYGLAAQDSGYYFAYTVSSDQARSDIVNYQTMLFGNGGFAPIIRKYKTTGSGFHNFYIALQSAFSTVHPAVSATPAPKAPPASAPKPSAPKAPPVPKPTSVQNEAQNLSLIPVDTLYKAIRSQDYMETVSTRLLLKKLIKRMIPKFIWNPLAKKRQKKLDERGIRL